MPIKLPTGRRPAAPEPQRITPPPEKTPYRWRRSDPPLPDWTAVSAEARGQAEADAKSRGFDEVSVKTDGFEPPYLLILDAKRQQAIEAVNAHFAEQRPEAEAARAAHRRDLAEAENRYTIAQAEYMGAKAEVSRLTTAPSKWPGDGRPSSLALYGGFKEFWHAWGAPTLILLALLLVETPIYFQMFQVFGHGWLLTVSFAVGAILVLAVGPHYYGRVFRRWEEYHRWAGGGRRRRGDGRGGDPAAEAGAHPGAHPAAPSRPELSAHRHGIARRPVLLFVIPVIWFAVIAGVTTLRLVSLTDPEPFRIADLEITPPTLESFWEIAAVVAVLLGLMIFTALIAAELGRRTGNPNDHTLKEQRARLARAKQEFDEAAAELRECTAYAKKLDQYIEGFDRSRVDHVQRIDSGFDRVEIEYVQALGRHINVPGIVPYLNTALERHQRRHYTQAES